MSNYLAKLSGPAMAAGALALALTGAPQAAQAQSPCGAAVTVSPGDTLYRIANRCGTSVQALVRANQIPNPNRIEVGQRIRMPGADTARAPQEQRRALAADNRYRVRSGDTLYRVSRQFGIPLQVILSLNPDLDPRRMPPGFVIRLPGDGGGGGRPGDGDGRGMTVTGVVTGEGVECPSIRGQDGQLYTLVGNLDDLQPGDRVQVQGQRAEASFCMQGTTLEVRRMRHVG